MGKLKIVYFPLRGRVQSIRFMLEDNDIEYEFESWPLADWMQDKEKTPFGQLPYMVDGDLVVAQSGAIMRYLARKHGLCGKDEKENALIDMVQEAYMELFHAWATTVFSQNYEADKATFAKSLPGRLKYLEKHLGKNNEGTGFFVGNKISYADYSMFDVLYDLQKWDSGCLGEFPLLKGFYDRMGARKKIRDFSNREDIKAMMLTGSGRI